MTFLMASFIALAILPTAVLAAPPEEIRSYFEWGEYRQLIDSLEPVLADSAATLDSTIRARYYLYLGVAMYGTGRVGDARKAFLTALRLDPLQRPDRRYISDEIDNLFSVTLTDYTEEQRLLSQNDSLLLLQQQAFTANVRALRSEELQRSRIAGRMIAVSAALIGLAVSGIAVYEYYATGPSYDEFRQAAAAGDVREYHRLQPVIRRANGIMTGCAVTAGISEVAGLFFALRVRLQRKVPHDDAE